MQSEDASASRVNDLPRLRFLQRLSTGTEAFGHTFRPHSQVRRVAMGEFKDKVKGKANQVVGQSKQDSDDSDTRREGRAQELKGMSQELKGKSKEVAKGD